MEGRSRRNRPDQICLLWNEGRCTFPYCRYRHVCSKCSGEHRGVHCRIQPPTDRLAQRPGLRKPE